jgi:aspartate aminotransferase
MLSARIKNIEKSITLAISAKAKAMKAKGEDVIGFGAGEPDFDTPEHIKQAAKDAIDAGFTKYTPATGAKDLKQAIIKKLASDNDLNYRPQQILVSCGAKHSLFNAIVALTSEDDEVIIPAPYWVSYPQMVKAAGATPVILETRSENGFKLQIEELKKKITPKTKLLILNSPSNPTGAMYEKAELEQLVKILVDNNIYCISDEIYEKIIYQQQAPGSIASLGNEVKNLTIVINGVSKAYSMTGWRIGYAAASEEVITAMGNLQSHSTSGPCSISQKAALAALVGPQDCVKQMVSEFKQRRDFIVKELNKIEGVSCFNPQGAFYVFPSIKKLLGKKIQGQTIKDSLDFCQSLLAHQKVAAVPGVGFGADGYLRLSYATSSENITEGIKRLKQFVANLEN